MPLPPPVLDALKRSATPETGAAADHRTDPRVAVGTTVAVTVSPVDPDGEYATLRMRVSDYSTGGLGLLNGHPLSLGAEVIVRVPNPEPGAHPFDLRCTVRSCRLVADGVYRLGVMFEYVEK